MIIEVFAAVVAGLITWIALRRPERRVQGIGALPRGADPVSPSLPLVLEMLIVAIRHGSSIPTALHTLGTLVGGPFGGGLLRVTQALHRGTPWAEAWSLVLADPQCGAAFRQIDRALEDSWRYGQSPVGSLQAAIDSIRVGQQSDIERGAARLSVRLLLPTGFCFLPAFIFIGVIPAIASMVG